MTELVDEMSAEDVADLCNLVGDYLDSHDTDSVRRYALDGDVTAGRELWRGLVADLQVGGLAIAPEHGGFGVPLSGQVRVVAEVGSRLTPIPLLTSTVISTAVIAHAVSVEAGGSWLRALAVGDATLVPGLGADRLDWHREIPQLRLDANGAATGRLDQVPDAALATHLVAFAALPGESAAARLVVVELASLGVSVSPLESVDATRPLSLVELDQAEVHDLGEVNADAVAHVRAVAAVALAAESVAAARAVLDATVRHAAERQQFGVPIGSFQAVKHRLADAFIEVEAAAAAVEGAASDLTVALSGDPLSASVALASASTALWDASRSAVQVQGAIGFTWEANAHLYLKRALVSRTMFGGTSAHRRRLGAALLREATHPV